MLPKIFDIATQLGLVLDTKTLKQKEVRCKCPFCLEDSNKPNKFYLSLNTQDQVYKCWFCKVGGGVLDFEARLTGETYENVKKKYFQNSRTLHPTESLNNQQLAAIGFKNKNDVKQNLYDSIYQRWINYEQRILSELFAELLLISYLPMERQQILIPYLQERCKKSVVRNAFERINHELLVEDRYKSAWAIDGLSIARISWKIAKDTNKWNAVIYQIPFIHFLVEKQRMLKQAVSV